MQPRILRFTKRERWGFIVWCVCITLISFSASGLLSFEKRGDERIWRVYQAYLDSLTLLESKNEDKTLELYTFDPNLIQAEELQSMGLDAGLAERWVNFRKYIGAYKDVEDIARIYGMDLPVLEQLEECLLFQESDPVHHEFRTRPTRQEKDLVTADTIPRDRQSPDLKSKVDINTCTASDLSLLGFEEHIAQRIIKYRNKYGPFNRLEDLFTIYDIDTQWVKHSSDFLLVEVPAIEAIDLNKATHSDLMKLRGIGPVLAERIVGYRNKLGGFLKIEQLQDVYGIDDSLMISISQKVLITEKDIRQIPINEVSKEELAEHPYISWQEAQFIINFRKHHYPIRNISDILALQGETIEKIRPYLNYEIKEQKSGEVRKPGIAQ